MLKELMVECEGAFLVVPQRVSNVVVLLASDQVCFGPIVVVEKTQPGQRVFRVGFELEMLVCLLREVFAFLAVFVFAHSVFPLIHCLLVLILVRWGFVHGSVVVMGLFVRLLAVVRSMLVLEMRKFGEGGWMLAVVSRQTSFE